MLQRLRSLIRSHDRFNLICVHRFQAGGGEGHTDEAAAPADEGEEPPEEVAVQAHGRKC